MLFLKQLRAVTTSRIKSSPWRSQLDNEKKRKEPSVFNDTKSKEEKHNLPNFLTNQLKTQSERLSRTIVSLNIKLALIVNLIPSNNLLHLIDLHFEINKTFYAKCFPLEIRNTSTKGNLAN